MPKALSQTYVTIDSLKGIVLPILVADRGRPICDTFLPLHQTSMSSRSTSCLIKVIKMTRPTRVIRITMITTNDRPVSRIKVYWLSSETNTQCPEAMRSSPKDCTMVFDVWGTVLGRNIEPLGDILTLSRKLWIFRNLHQRWFIQHQL